MASDTDRADDSLTHRTEDDVTPAKLWEEVNDRLFTLSEKITKCDIMLNDLKDLKDVLARKSLQDLTFPSQE